MGYTYDLRAMVVASWMWRLEIDVHLATNLEVSRVRGFGM